MKSLLTITLLLLTTIPASAVSPDRVRDLNQQARTFAQQKDWKSLRGVLLQIGEELGTPTPYHMLRMASVEVHLGNNNAALQWMSRYAATGLNYDIASDDDLKPLLADKAYAPIADEMRAKTQPVTNADIVCTLPISDVMPEDLTYDTASRTFIVSSVQHYTLYRISLPKNDEKECGAQEIKMDASAPKWPTFAVSADPTRPVLWTTVAAVTGFEGISKEDTNKTALLAIDIKSGQVLRRFDLEAKGPSILGDMSVADDGTVYVTDSVGGGVYRVHGDLQTAKLEKIADGLFSPQTPVLAKDGKHLFVADYSLGVAVIDLSTGKVDYLRHPDNIAVPGLDGLHLVGDSLLGVQNGTDPERIVRFQLNPAQTEIIGQEIIEQGPRIGDPTHVISVDGMAYVSTNVGWNKIDDFGKLKAGEHFASPVLMRFPVK